ncbi:MAG: acid phosphatase [Sterolibacterium sp.]
MTNIFKRTTALLSLLCQAVPGLAAAPAPALDKALQQIEHIVVIVAENRSFDNLYGLFPGANGITRANPAQWTQTDHNGEVLPQLPRVWNDKAGHFKSDLPNRPFRIDGAPIHLGLEHKTSDLTHRFYQNIEQINGGKLDRYAALSGAGGLTMGYYDGSRMKMWAYAKEFVLADNFFMAAYGGSFLNHFWLICACTPFYPDAPDRLKVQLDGSGKLKRDKDSPASALAGPSKFLDGELTPDGYAVNNMQPSFQPSGIAPAAGGDSRFADPARHPLPPQKFHTIGDTLSTKGISWAWYAGAWRAAQADGARTPVQREVIYSRKPGSASLEAHHQPFNYFARFAPGSVDRERHLRDGNELLEAIQGGKLPQVVFYKPESSLNEHPGYADVLTGDAHIAQLVALLQASPQWRSMAIFVTYDENGGFWDHAAPPSGAGWSDRWGPGTRVPLIVISPYAKKASIDSTLYDTTSIIKFITRRFELDPLPGVRSKAGDLTNSFDFSRQ